LEGKELKSGSNYPITGEVDNRNYEVTLILDPSLEDKDAKGRVVRVVPM
jgi:hypothetical protein